MPTIEENRQRWNAYDWSEGGDEWSFVWGGTPNLWWGAIYPRIRHLLPVPVVLEIAPGLGRFTQYLRTFCDEIHLIDISDRAIEGCRKRFGEDGQVVYHVGDGQSLGSVPEHKIDFQDTPDPALLREIVEDAKFQGGDDEIHFSFGVGFFFERFQLDFGADFSDINETYSLSGVFRF